MVEYLHLEVILLILFALNRRLNESFPTKIYWIINPEMVNNEMNKEHEKMK